MFATIKWRFVTIYFLLVLICMAIVGSFIINRLESQQIETVTTEMSQTLDSIVNTSSYLTNQEWESVSNHIEKNLDEWRLSSNESIFVISNDSVPKIITSTVTTKDLIKGSNALAYKEFSTDLILKALKGDVGEGTVENLNNNTVFKHIAKPVFSGDGDIKGVFYMITNLDSLYKTIEDAKVIITYATAIGLTITTVLGYILANSITGPIRDVTKKAEEMAEGNFDQRVDVKSDDEIGQLASMFNYLTEELKNTISEMDLERDKLDTIFNYMAEGVIAVDRESYLIHANPTARVILDIEDEYVLKVKQDLRKLNIKKVNYYNLDTLSGESQVEIKDCFYNVKYAPYKNDRGFVSGIIVVFQDITKEHKLDMMRKEFVANVSHELKTPLTTIKSYVETLIEADLKGSAQKRFLGIIDRESDRMIRIVRDLLQLSNLDYKNENWNIECINTYEAIESVVESLELMIREKNHTVNLNIDYDIAMICADRHATDQILMNIVSNAVKYTEPGGKIDISAKSYGEKVFINVKDNGIGIPSNDLQRIFERFYRVEKGRSRGMGGTGLGLSIAKEIIESMGGRIRIQSEFNVGTEIKLVFKSC